MRTTKHILIGNYATVAEILQVLKEHKVDPADAEVVAETLQDYGGPFTTVQLQFQVDE